MSTFCLNNALTSLGVAIILLFVTPPNEKAVTVFSFRERLIQVHRGLLKCPITMQQTT